MVVNQVEVNDINFPLLTIGGRAVSNTAVVTKSLRQMDTFSTDGPSHTVQPIHTPETPRFRFKSSIYVRYLSSSKVSFFINSRDEVLDNVLNVIGALA